MLRWPMSSTASKLFQPGTLAVSKSMRITLDVMRIGQSGGVDGRVEARGGGRARLSVRAV